MKPVVLLLGARLQPLPELVRYFALIHLADANPLALAFHIVARRAEIVHIEGYDLACLVVAKLLGARVVLQNAGGRTTRLADVTLEVPESIERQRLADDLTVIYSLVLPWPASQAG